MYNPQFLELVTGDLIKYAMAPTDVDELAKRFLALTDGKKMHISKSCCGIDPTVNVEQAYRGFQYGHKGRHAVKLPPRLKDGITNILGPMSGPRPRAPGSICVWRKGLVCFLCRAQCFWKPPRSVFRARSIRSPSFRIIFRFSCIRFTVPRFVYNFQHLTQAAELHSMILFQRFLKRFCLFRFSFFRFLS